MIERTAAPPAAAIFAGGASVSWHFAFVGPVVTVEVEELHPIPNAIATTDSSTNECCSTFLAITARRGSLESIEAPDPNLRRSALVHPCASGSDVLGRHVTSVSYLDTALAGSFNSTHGIGNVANPPRQRCLPGQHGAALRAIGECAVQHKRGRGIVPDRHVGAKLPGEGRLTSASTECSKTSATASINARLGELSPLR